MNRNENMDQLVYETYKPKSKKSVKVKFKFSNQKLRELENDKYVGTISLDDDFIYADIGTESPIYKKIPNQERHTVEYIES